MPDTPGLLPPNALAHIRKYDDEWDGQTVALLVAHIDALTAAATEAVARMAVGDPEYPLSRVLAILRGEQ